MATIDYNKISPRLAAAEWLGIGPQEVTDADVDAYRTNREAAEDAWLDAHGLTEADLQAFEDQRAANEAMWAEQEASESSWAPVDWSKVDGKQLPPKYLHRVDGQPLLYPGKTHVFAGESESGKSWLGQLLALERVQAGENVLYLDFESDPVTMRDRFFQVGMTQKQLLQVSYVAPQSMEFAIQGLELALAKKPTVAVLDGLAEAMVLEEVDENSNGEVTAYMRGLPQLLTKLGMAVVIIDHVAKAGDTRGGRGAGAKINTVTGAYYKVKRVVPFAVGKAGRSKIVVEKDRGGLIRGKALEEVIAVLTVSETGQFKLDTPNDVDVVKKATAEDQVLACFWSEPNDPLTRKNVQTITGLAQGTVQGALDKLVTSDHLVVIQEAKGPKPAVYKARPSI